MFFNALSSESTSASLTNHPSPRFTFFPNALIVLVSVAIRLIKLAIDNTKDLTPVKTKESSLT
ncbi:hypothetical protein Sez_0038 [Streptococcus equi subsp. zooepidemicus MGCS10565]|uniref:Uncharacterized protein n=1 Tax=Streptococcus equi subsp. zooepidemicus (strain MGCS10565) TaxID=552526 RepID=B4U5F9_STREM|nr:hypothetical protein Sez_0038 [Streptococcus equi subsp. zooepidemicus MGCS10565]